MKRIVCLILCFVIAFLVLSPVLADTSSYEYPPVIFYLSTKSQLEKEFREFVKKLSREYYYGNYDLNKYYYEAATVKYEWDKGGFLGSRKDNPYSTVKDGNPNYDHYNVPLIQQMLINNLKEHAKSVQTIAISDYSPKMTINPVTGEWEVNGRVVLAQAIYDEEVNNAITQAENQLAGTLVNSVVDVAVVYATKGKTPAAYANYWDALTNVIVDGLNSYAEIQYRNLAARKQNEYRDKMREAVFDLYDHVEEYMLSDSERLLNELETKNDLSDDELVLKEQVTKVLTAVKNMPKHLMTVEDQELLNQIAGELVDASGLTEQKELPEELCTAFVFQSVVKSIVLNVADATIKTVWPDLSIWKTIGKDIAIFIADEVWSRIIENDIYFYDYEGDNSCSAWEAFDSACEMIFGGNIFTDVMKEFFEGKILEAYVKKVSHGEKTDAIEKGIKELQEKIAKNTGGKTIKEAEQYIKELEKQQSRNAIKHASRRSTNFMEEESARQSLRQNKINIRKAKVETDELNKLNLELANEKKTAEKAGKKLREEINANHLTGVGILIEDIIQVVCDTLIYAKESASLGDTLDDEVGYAYIACEMYHTMKIADIRRASMNNEYAQLQYSSIIDVADIDVLKAFVNRIFSIYQTDGQGHLYYISLDHGWQYQTKEKYQEAMDDYSYRLSRACDEHPYIMGTFGGFFAVTFIQGAYMVTGSSKSEYLKEVNKKKDQGGYGWIDEDTAFDVYDQIVEYAEAARIPDKFKSIGK